MNLRRDIALSAAALLLPTAAMVGAALALLKPVPLPAARPVPVAESLPAKAFTERFAAAFVVPSEPEGPVPPVPLPPVRPPQEPDPSLPPPEPPPPPTFSARDSAPGGAVARSSGLRMVAADICARHGGWRVDSVRSWHCKFRRRP